MNNTLAAMAQKFAGTWSTVLKTLARTLGANEDEVVCSFPTDYNVFQLQQMMEDYSALVQLVDNPEVKRRVDRMLIQRALSNFIDYKELQEIVNTV